MTRWTDHNDTERMVMLQQAADAEGLPEYAVEKDWWVTMVLKAMFQTSVTKWLEFKGGTSLSKGWRCLRERSWRRLSCCVKNFRNRNRGVCA